MATRMLSPDGACDGVTVPYGRSARRYGGTTIEVSETSHVQMLREAGYTVADVSGAPTRAAGFVCKPCAFKSFFKVCSKCGSECERPDLVA